MNLDEATSALESSNETMRVNAAKALGASKDPLAVAALIGALEQSQFELMESPPEDGALFRKACLDALADLADPSAASAVEFALTDFVEDVRRAAANAIIHFGPDQTRSSVESFINQMNLSTPGNRLACMSILGYFNAADELARSTLEQLLQDSDPTVRSRAREVLDTLPISSTTDPTQAAELNKRTIIRQESAAAPIHIDPGTITHAFIALTHDDLKFASKADGVVANFNRHCQPRIWSVHFPVKFVTFGAPPDSNGYPDPGCVEPALEGVGLTNPSSIVINNMAVSFDRGHTRSNLLIGFAFKDANPRLIIPCTDGCVPE
jgi:PBS lyase HEAT-like repeat-containing protein